MQPCMRDTLESLGLVCKHDGWAMVHHWGTTTCGQLCGSVRRWAKDAAPERLVWCRGGANVAAQMPEDLRDVTAARPPSDGALMS